MRQQMKHNLYEFEVMPPPASWKDIAARLDDDSFYSFVSSKLNIYEVMPPVSSQNAVIERLTDDSDYIQISSKVRSYELSPFTDSWKSISEELDKEHHEESKTLVIPLSKKIYNYAAVAIVIAVVAGISWLFVNNSKNLFDVAADAGKQTGKTASPFQNDKGIKSGNETNNGAIAKNTETEKNNETLNDQSTYTTQSRLLKYSKISSPFSQIEQPIIISSKAILDEKGAVVRDMDILTTNNNYLVVTGPDGQLTRISSKFANVIRFLNSGEDVEEYLDKVIRESSLWKKRFQEWRGKISQSAFIPSSANFLDILDFKELIDEKNISN